MATDELKISNAEHKSRIEKIQKQLRRRRIDALYLTNSTRILYTTGFAHISTERPLAAVIPNEEQPFFMAPHLEYDHIRQECPLASDVLTYPDYPGKYILCDSSRSSCLRKALPLPRLPQIP